jgi:LacI family transcriptional regulator
VWVATIRDIARRAGVSVATVSRVVNGLPGVSNGTKEKVLKVTHELQYRPNAVARSLVTRRSYILGVFFLDPVNSDLRHPFFQDVLAGFKQRVGHEGYDLLVFNNSRPGEAGLSFAQRCWEQQVDGVLVVGVPRINPDLHELATSGIPCMGVDCELVGPKAGHISSDNIGGAARAVEHLIRLGHRRIAMINGSGFTKVSQDRLIGYRQALRAAGLPYQPGWVLEGDFTQAAGYDCMQQLLKGPELPKAVFSAADMMAIGAIEACQAAGLRVPEDVSVVGFDDINLASVFRPQLTTVRQQSVLMGRMAAEALVSMIGSDDFTPPVTTVPVELVVRETTAPPRH